MFSPSFTILLLTSTIVGAAVTPLSWRNLTSNDLILWGSDGKVEVMKYVMFPLKHLFTEGGGALQQALNESGMARSSASLSFLMLIWFCWKAKRSIIPNSQHLSVVRKVPQSASPSTPQKGELLVNLSISDANHSIFMSWNPNQHFLNWDVPMSSVVHAVEGQGGAMVDVNSGYQVQFNSIIQTSNLQWNEVTLEDSRDSENTTWKFRALKIFLKNLDLPNKL